MKTEIEEIKRSIREVHDFPIPGIVFKDLGSALKNPRIFNLIANHLTKLYQDKGITKVVGIESRGFIMGSVLAYRLQAGFVLARKPGKLPGEIISESYQKEYGTDTIEIQTGTITPDDVVLIHDDLLATGGTIIAVQRLVKRFQPRKIYTSFIVELEFLHGRELFPEGMETESLIKF